MTLLEFSQRTRLGHEDYPIGQPYQTVIIRASDEKNDGMAVIYRGK